MYFQAIQLSKSYGKQAVFNGVSFSCEAGEILSILGTSGCGKTTLLKCIAGIEPLNSGQVRLAENNITHWLPNQRQIIYLSQEALLFPHLNVFENVAFGLRMQKLPTKFIQQEVEALLESLQLNDCKYKKHSELSGGQKQRVAFGRALILKPNMLLLDEPFGNLDSTTRHHMQQLFLQVAKDHHITAMFVTHDVKEALLMGNKWGIMHHSGLEIFDDNMAFVKNERSGAAGEINFWTNLQPSQNI